MATTTNFGWTTPDDTDLVKDGAAAIRTLGSAIDTSLVDLKGGTTGQVLAKASNTDLDFTWSSVDPLTILDAKGDLISATAADTPARLAVGADGTVLTADSAEATGLKWATPVAGGMTLISTTTLSGVSTVLTSIPQTYTDLLVIVSNVTGNTANSRLSVRTNNTTSGNYYILGENASAGAESNTVIYLSGNQNTLRTSNNNAWAIIFNNYASTTLKKPLQFYGTLVDATSTDLNISGNGAFRSTTAISSLGFYYGGTNTFAGGTVELYGVK